jgi:hypothetical protein
MIYAANKEYLCSCFPSHKILHEIKKEITGVTEKELLEGQAFKI